MLMDGLFSIYSSLLKSFGHQNWWPTGRGFTPAEFEVCVGAILTQNTSWNNVEKALELMKSGGFTNPLAVSTAEKGMLEQAVRQSGFYKQKAERLKIFSDFVMGFGGFRGFSKNVTREQLLKLKGIGSETADSMLLYALDRSVFVIDAYTKRVFARLGICPKGYSDRKEMESNLKYDDWRYFFESNLPMDTNLYKEFHALIVELAKRHCRKKPACEGCPLGKRCAAML